MLHLPLSFPGWERDLLSNFMAMPSYPSCRGSACAPRLYPAAAAAPTFRVLRAAPAFPEPEEPEVYIQRTEEGVVAACPLGHGFSRDDISLELDGRDLTITAWHPQTRHWRAYGRERPAAYQRTLELAPHIDAQRMRARMDTAAGTLELFFPYRRVAPAPQPRPRMVVVQQSAMAVPVPPAAAPRFSMARASVPAAPAPRTAPAPAPAAPVAAPSAPPAAAPMPAPAAEAEADDAPAVAQRAQRRRQRHPHHVHRRRSCSPKQAEPACPCCCCQAPSTAPTASGSQQQQPRQQSQPKAQPRVIPVESGEASTSAPAAKPQLQTSRPSSPVAASPAASSKAAKGKGPASPEQIAQWQRQQRAAAAAKRIAAGVASDSDWEDADGSVSECGLDD